MDGPQVFDAMRVGKDALDEINKEMSLEAVEALLEETEEATALHKQIEETLMGRLTVVEEEEMERELEAMMGHSVAEELPQVPTKLPDVPSQLPGATRWLLQPCLSFCFCICSAAAAWIRIV